MESEEPTKRSRTDIPEQQILVSTSKGFAADSGTNGDEAEFFDRDIAEDVKSSVINAETSEWNTLTLIGHDYRIGKKPNFCRKIFLIPKTTHP